MTIRETIQAQASKLGLTAYAIAHAAKRGKEFIVSVDHVQHYLSGRKDMTSHKIDAIMKVLGLEISYAKRISSPTESGSK